MNKLQYISWINKNSVFDKSLGKFEEIDFFTFLENLSSFDYSDTTIYDDFYYILEYTNDTILHLINNINKEIKRKHEVMSISKAREFDKESILWISKKPGRSIKEKLKQNKIKALKRFDNIDTYENRIFKKFLKAILFESENRDDLDKFEKLFTKIREFLRSDIAKLIDERKRIVYNNILLHHKHYKKIFKAYKWLNNLDEKYKNITPNFHLVVKYETLFQLQFFTDKLILPDTLKIDYENLSIENKLPCLDCGSLKIDTTFKFETLREELKSFIPYTTSKLFNVSFEEEKVYIDLFRAFPIAKIDEKIIEFPIMLKQKIDNKIINANNTKIIDLNKEFFTLSEILHSLDTTILKYFLKDLEKHFKNSAIFYILPDYINQFEFGEIKKTLNSYFKTKIIPKSILAGINYIFEQKVKENDTLIYIQKNYNNELFVTPLLVKYDEKLTITNGLYLEKHPTKKLENSNNALNILQNYFDETASKKLLNKFLQNGIKKLSQQNIKFLKDNQIITIKNLEFNQKQIYNIKYLFNPNILFKENTIFIEDENIQNLTNYQKIIKFEKDGFLLWKEHLPKLAMQIIKNGYFDEFILVDEDSKLTNKQIQIKQHFIIPANKKEISFPLIFGDESIDFEAYITSKEMPFDEDVECKLQLRYDYEAENPYKLIFYPLNGKKPLQVKWREIDYKDINYPNFINIKSWDELRKDPKKNGGYSDLLDWVLERLIWLDINKIPPYLIEKEKKELRRKIDSSKTGIIITIRKDRANQEFYFVKVEGIDEDIFCHSSNFIEKKISLKIGDKIYLNIKSNKKGQLTGDNIYLSKNLLTDEYIENLVMEKLTFFSKKETLSEKYRKIVTSLRSLKYPLLTIFNSHSLDEQEIPPSFKEKINNYIQLGLKLLQQNIPKELEYELLFFLSVLHKNTPDIITEKLITFSTNLIEYKEYYKIIGLALGDLSLQWQQKIVANLLKQFKDISIKNHILYILGVASWKDKNLIFYFSKTKIKTISINLLNALNFNMKLKPNLDILARELELLLALIRRREKEEFLLPKEQITQRYIKTIDTIALYLKNNKINLKSKVQLEINKPTNIDKNISDLLYALRLYLSGDSGTSSIKIIGVKDD